MIRELFYYIGKRGRIAMFGAVLSETGNALIYAAVMLTVFEMLYAVIAEPDVSLMPYIFRFVLLLTGKFICTTISMITMHAAGFEIETALKARIVRRLKQFSLGFYTNEQLGNISTVVHDDIENLRQSTSHIGVNMIADTITAFVIGAALFALNWQMGLVMISLLPVSFLLQRLNAGKSLRLKNENAKNLGVMVSRFVEFTKNIPMLKTFSGGLLFQADVKESAADFARSSKTEAWQAAKDSLRYFLPFELCFAFIALVGGVLAASGNISVTDFVYFIVFSQLFYIPFANMELYRLTWTQIKSSFGRVSKLLRAPVPLTPELPQKPNGFDIAFRHVGFQYAENGFVLQDADFHLPQGSLTALAGASGSGKTTVMNLILRFWDVTTGSIEAGGVDIRQIEYDEWLSYISIVMQNVILFADTIYENIRTGNPDATKEQVEEAAKKAQIHDFIMSLPESYATMLGENGARLSGGEKQRISIARAFLKNSPILLLDEVTSNVDPLNEVLIQKAISELSKGRTVLMITHHLQMAQSAERILVFDGGKIAEIGTHKELLENNNTYAKLWNSQAKAREWGIQ